MLVRYLVTGFITLSVLPLSLLPPVALGEDEASREEMLITTARKREEDLQKVPVSITTFTAEQIEAANITTTLDLANATPGLYFEAFNSGSASFPVIRGLSQQNISFDMAIDNNVGRFIDGIYQTNRNAPDIELLDLERIEVIKGPQNAMFGRSTFAGAINYVTKKPGDELETKVKVGAGTDEDYMVFGSVSGPLIGDTLLGRISGGYREFDGTTENLGNPGDNLGGYEETTINGSLVSQIGRFSATLDGFYNDRDNEHSSQHLISDFNCGMDGYGGFLYLCGDVPFVDPVDISPDAFGTENESWQGVLTLEYELEWATLSSISSYSDQETLSLQDTDYTSGGQPHPVCDFNISGPACFGFFPPPPVSRIQDANVYNHASNSVEDFSQEFRIQSNSAEGLTWMAGVYYFDSDNNATLGSGVDGSVLAPGEFYTGFAGFLATPDPVNAPVPVSDWDSGTETIAVFGQVGFDITDKLRLDVEARYTNEEKSIDSRLNFFAPGTGKADDDFNMFTPRVTLDYQTTENIMLYGNVARGTRAGGFNGSYPLPTCSIPTFTDQVSCEGGGGTWYPGIPGEQTFDDESNWTYEIGVKTTWPQYGLTANLDVYYVDWEDMQIAGASESTNPSFRSTVIRNIGGVDSWGLEFDVQGVAADFLTYGVAYAYSNPEYKSGSVDQGAATTCINFLGVPSGTDICNFGPNNEILVGGNQLGRMAEHQASANATFFGNINSQWRWSVRGDINYSGDVYTRSINQQEYGDRTIVNGRITVETDSLTIALWGRNLFDDEYVIANALQPRTFVARATDHTQSEGRRAGISLEYRF
ncbi:MAG TPA: TonB-dependent receptor [Gammaproteobacteria bacterium]|jgi:iron complex outermembrane receptor protein|nr:TonB-dependent receptor [Gammaproteobacteria bacterium]HJP39445.1 TonB-dependent receptor [Gammaproteobacteria bacterium]